MTTPLQTTRLLVERGLLSMEELVEGSPVLLRDYSRRNRNTAIEGPVVPPLFVKSGDAPGIAAEAEAYERLATECPDVAAMAPRVVLADPAGGLLVVERLEGVDLRRHHLATGGFPSELAALLGGALGALHRATRRAAAAPPGETGSPPSLAFHRPRPASLAWLTSGSIEMISIIQGQPDLCERLDEIRRTWRREALIHGDLRWDNVLVRAVPARGLAVVDWEHAGDGDPCWDLGCALASPLSFWAFSVPHSGTDPPAPAPERALLPLSAMRPGVTALWREYVLAAGLGPAASAACLDRSVALAGARLIQIVYEGAQTAGVLNGPMILHLQLAMNLLTRPSAAARDLLGLTPRQWDAR